MFVVKGELTEKTIELIREGIGDLKGLIYYLCNKERDLVEKKFKNKIGEEEFKRKLKGLEKEIADAKINIIQLQKIVN